MGRSSWRAQIPLGWLVGLRCVSQYNKGDWASANCFVSIVLYWVNSYGDMVWNQSVWRKVIDSKYGYDICQWTPKRCKGLMRWGFGITLRKGWDQFASHIRYEVGDGSQELFWKNHWDGNSSFQDRHPELFRFNRDKDARVFDCMEWVQSKAH